MGGTVNVQQYQKNVNRVFDKWSSAVANARAKIARINQDIERLEKQIECSTPEGEKKFKAEVEVNRKQREKFYGEILAAGMSLRADLMLLPPLEPMTKSNEKDYLKLPGFIKKLVEDEGVELGKTGIVVKPDVDFDFKKGKLEKFGLEFKVKWK